MTLIPTLGLIVPPAHGRVPDDGPRLYAGRAHFLARGLGIDSISSGGFAPVIEAIRDHAVALRNDGVRAISLMGTSLSFHRGLTFTEDLCAQMADVTGLPCTTMSHAIVRALRTLGVRRVAVATAYTDALNHDLKRFLTGLDFEVTALEGLDMTDVLAVGRVGPDVLTPTRVACARAGAARRWPAAVLRRPAHARPAGTAASALRAAGGRQFAGRVLGPDGLRGPGRHGARLRPAFRAARAHAGAAHRQRHGARLRCQHVIRAPARRHTGACPRIR